MMAHSSWALGGHGRVAPLDPPVPVSQRTCWKLSLALPAQKRRCAVEDRPRPSRHQIKHGGDSLRSSRRHPGHAGDFSPPPPPGGSTDIGAECRSRPFRPTKDKMLCWKQSSALPALKGTCRRPSRVPNGKSDMLEAVPGPPASKRTSVSVSVSVFSHQTGRTQ